MILLQIYTKPIISALRSARASGTAGKSGHPSNRPASSRRFPAKGRAHVNSPGRSVAVLAGWLAAATWSRSGAGERPHSWRVARGWHEPGRADPQSATLAVTSSRSATSRLSISTVAPDVRPSRRCSRCIDRGGSLSALRFCGLLNSYASVWLKRVCCERFKQTAGVERATVRADGGGEERVHALAARLPSSVSGTKAGGPLASCCYVLLGDVDSVTVEDMGEISLGAEFTLRCGDKVEVHQVKRQHGSASEWKLSDLNGERRAGRREAACFRGRRFWFVSTIPSVVLSQLADAARRSPDVGSFVEHMLSSEAVACWLGLSDRKRLRVARRCLADFAGLEVLWPDERDLLHTNAALAGLLLDGQPRHSPRSASAAWPPTISGFL